jgi:ATP-binding cassette subfamily B multidrug efflux pump
VVWAIGKLRSFCIPYRWTLYVSVVMLALFTATTLVTPYLTRALINSVLDQHHWGDLWWIVLAVPGLAVVGGVLNFGFSYNSSLFGQKCTYRLREALYARLQHHGFEFYDREHTGNLMQRLTGDVEAWRMYLSQGIINGFNFLFNVGFGLVVMFTLDARLTLLTLVFMPFLAVAVLRFDHRVRPIYSAIRQMMSQLQTVVQENIVGVRVVKAFAREPYELDKFREKNLGYARENLRAGREQARFIPLMQLLGNLSAVVLLWYGGMQVLHGTETIGALVAFFGLLGYLTGPTQQLGFLVNLYAQAHAAEERLLEILETPDIVRDRPGAVVLRRELARGHVRFDRVTFRYPGAKVPSLYDFSLDAPPGKVVALLGPTGSGKSTVVNLIPRFYETEQGRVLFDGRDVRDWTVASLRRQIGIVPGETFLFSATILENIAYGRSDATLEEVRRAAAMAQADEFIMELPDKYDTVVGERGLGLSGGQKQRIAIARALLYDPKVLILDDATSSVDLETEYEIQQALEQAMAGRTTFIIAHRLSSVRRADEIVVLDHGRVVERGRHEELLARGGLYRQLFDIQFRDRDMLRRSAREGVRAHG